MAGSCISAELNSWSSVRAIPLASEHEAEILHLWDVLLTRLDGTVVDGSEVGASNHTVSGKVAVQDREQLKSTRGGAPVTHQLADHSEVGHNVDTGLTHAVVSLLTDVNGGGSRGLVVGPDAVASFTERESSESSAYCSESCD